MGTSFPTWNEGEIVDQHSRGVVRETVNERERARHHTHLHSVPAGYNACILEAQAVVDDGTGWSFVAEQCFLQADQAALVDASTSPSSRSSQTPR